jgi:hypothetical protein
MFEKITGMEAAQNKNTLKKKAGISAPAQDLIFPAGHFRC